MRRKFGMIVVIVLLGAAVAAYLLLFRVAAPNPEADENCFPRCRCRRRALSRLPLRFQHPLSQPSFIPLEATPSVDTLPELDQKRCSHSQSPVPDLGKQMEIFAGH